MLAGITYISAIPTETKYLTPMALSSSPSTEQT